MSIVQTHFSFVPVHNKPSTYYTETVKGSLTTQKTHEIFIEEFKKKPVIYQNSELEELDTSLLQNLDTSEFDLLQYIDCSNDISYTENNHTAPVIPDFLETLKDCIKNSPNKHRRKRDPFPLSPRRKYSLDFRKKVLNDVCYMNLKKAAQKHGLSINRVEDFIKFAIRQPSKYISKLEQQDYNTVDDTTSDIIDNIYEIDNFVLADDTCTNNNQDRNAFLTFLENYRGDIKPVLNWFLQSPSINAVFKRNVLKKTQQSQASYPHSWKYSLNDLQNKNIPMQKRSELFEQYIKSMFFNCAHEMSYENP